MQILVKPEIRRKITLSPVVEDAVLAAR